MSGGATPGPRRSRVGGWPIAAVLAVLAVLLYEIRVALLPFIFAVAVAFVLDPLIKRLEQQLGVPRWPVAAALYLLVLAVLGAVGYGIGASAARSLMHVVATAPNILRHFLGELIGGKGVILFGQGYTPDQLVQALGGALKGVVDLGAVG
jgi:predicted PurR-regulated permease PerM